MALTNSRETRRAHWEGAEEALRNVKLLVAEGWSYERAVSTVYGNAVRTLEHLGEPALETERAAA